MADAIASLAEAIAAIGALGTASFGLVDSLKIFPGSVQNIGFRYVAAALAPFGEALDAGLGHKAPSTDKASSADIVPNWRETMRAHYINGAPKADQKATAKALLRLGMVGERAEHFGLDGLISTAQLRSILDKAKRNERLSPDESNVLGQLDAVLEARLDSAFERAEQRYKTVMRFLASIAAVVLAIIGGAVILPLDGGADAAYGLKDFGLSILVGLIAVPLAPITKDLISSLGAAAKAVKAAKSL